MRADLWEPPFKTDGGVGRSFMKAYNFLANSSFWASILGEEIIGTFPNGSVDAPNMFDSKKIASVFGSGCCSHPQ